MAKITRYDGNLKSFASEQNSNERTVFGSETTDDSLDANINNDFLRGWGIVPPSGEPTLEDFNAAFYTLGQLLAYLHQLGIAEWNADQEYHQSSVAIRSNRIWQSQTDNNIGNDPADDDGTNWVKIPNQDDVKGLISDTTLLDDSNNLNNTTSTGRYRHTASSVPNNAPISDAGGFLIVDKGEPSDYIIQRWYARNGHRAFVRTYDGADWTDWKERLNVGDVDLSNYAELDTDVTFGAVTASSYDTTSDRRLKKNITTAPTGVMRLLAGKEYIRRSDGQMDSGIIAQELLVSGAGHLVKKQSDGTLTVNYNGLWAYAIEDYKSLERRVERLEALLGNE